MHTKFDQLLPPNTITIEASTAQMWNSGLLAEEAQSIKNACLKRKKEFTAGRNCSREALKHYGYYSFPVLSCPDRMPVFPSGLSGTITHTENYCAASIISKEEIISIGIDAEVNTPLDIDLRSYILLPDEQLMVLNFPTQSFNNWEKLIFSIKESFYKAYFQIHPKFLDFCEVKVLIKPFSNSFEVQVLKRNVPQYFSQNTFCGYYTFDQKLIYCAVALPKEPSKYRGRDSAICAL